jgi:hypothetical protein
MMTTQSTGTKAMEMKIMMSMAVVAIEKKVSQMHGIMMILEMKALRYLTQMMTMWMMVTFLYKRMK